MLTVHACTAASAWGTQSVCCCSENGVLITNNVQGTLHYTTRSTFEHGNCMLAPNRSGGMGFVPHTRRATANSKPPTARTAAPKNRESEAEAEAVVVAVAGTEAGPAAGTVVVVVVAAVAVVPWAWVGAAGRGTGEVLPAGTCKPTRVTLT